MTRITSPRFVPATAAAAEPSEGADAAPQVKVSLFSRSPAMPPPLADALRILGQEAPAAGTELVGGQYLRPTEPREPPPEAEHTAMLRRTDPAPPPLHPAP
jgi:hypothetical protein